MAAASPCSLPGALGVCLVKTRHLAPSFGVYVAVIRVSEKVVLTALTPNSNEVRALAAQCDERVGRTLRPEGLVESELVDLPELVS